MQGVFSTSRINRRSFSKGDEDGHFTDHARREGHGHLLDFSGNTDVVTGTGGCWLKMKALRVVTMG